MTFHDTPPAQGEPWWVGMHATSSTSGTWLVSSSAKVYLQVLRFVGDYRFGNDLVLNPGDTVPFAHKFPATDFGFLPTLCFDNFTQDEITDYCEANPGSPVCP